MSFEKKTYYKRDCFGNKIKCCFSTFKYKYYIVVKCSAGHGAVKQFKQFFSEKKNIFSTTLVNDKCPSLLDFSKSSYYRYYMKQCEENAKRLAFKFSKGLGCSLQLEKTRAQLNKSHVAQDGYVKPHIGRVKYNHDKRLESFLKESKYNASKNVVYSKPIELNEEKDFTTNQNVRKYIKDLYANNLIELDPRAIYDQTSETPIDGTSEPLADRSNLDYYGRKRIEPNENLGSGGSYFYKEFYSPLKGNVNTPPMALPKSIQFTNQLQSVLLPKRSERTNTHKKFITMNNQTICVDFKKSAKTECLIYISPLQGFCNLKYQSCGYKPERNECGGKIGGIFYSGDVNPSLSYDPGNLFKGVVVPCDLSVKLPPCSHSLNPISSSYVPSNTYNISSRMTSCGSIKDCEDPCITRDICEKPSYVPAGCDDGGKVCANLYDGESESSSEDSDVRGWDNRYQKSAYLKKKKPCEYRKRYNLNKEHCKSMFCEKLENYENCNNTIFSENGESPEVLSSRTHPIHGYQLNVNSKEYRKLLSSVYSPPSDMLSFEFKNLFGKTMNYQEASAYNPVHTKPNCMRVVDIPQTMRCIQEKTCEKSERDLKMSYAVLSPVACVQSLPVKYKDVKKYYY